MSTTKLAALSKKELARKSQLETAIERGQAAFVEVGQALAEIQSSKLYRDDFPTFEAYCRAKWGFEKSAAYQLVSAAIVAEELSAAGENSPQLRNEAQARELAKAPAGTRAKVLAEALEIAKAGGKESPTAADVKAVVEKSNPPKPAKTSPASALRPHDLTPEEAATVDRALDPNDSFAKPTFDAKPAPEVPAEIIDTPARERDCDRAAMIHRELVSLMGAWSGLDKQTGLYLNAIGRAITSWRDSDGSSQTLPPEQKSDDVRPEAASDDTTATVLPESPSAVVRESATVDSGTVADPAILVAGSPVLEDDPRCTVPVCGNAMLMKFAPRESGTWAFAYQIKYPEKKASRINSIWQGDHADQYTAELAALSAIEVAMVSIKVTSARETQLALEARQIIGKRREKLAGKVTKSPDVKPDPVFVPEELETQTVGV